MAQQAGPGLLRRSRRRRFRVRLDHRSAQLWTRLGFIGGIYDRVKNALPKYRVGLNGGLEYIRKAPIRPGDTLTGRGKLANLKESPRDDGGAMLLVTFEGNFTNQDGADVLTSRMTLIWMYGKEDLNG